MVELSGFRGCRGELIGSSVVRRSVAVVGLGELPLCIGAGDAGAALGAVLAVLVGGVLAGASRGGCAVVAKALRRKSHAKNLNMVLPSVDFPSGPIAKASQ